MIELPFISVLDCEVEYDGRAYSILERGNYLIIIKEDMSVMVHGGTLLNPLNYQREKTTISTESADGYTLLNCISKKESLKIKIYTILGEIKAKLCDNKIKITKTEREMVDWLINNIQILDTTPGLMVETETTTPYGPTDILLTTNDYAHIIEVKRKTASAAASGQLLKYYQYYREIYPTVKQTLVSPGISPACKKLLEKNNQEWFKLTFDDIKTRNLPIS